MEVIMVFDKPSRRQQLGASGEGTCRAASDCDRVFGSAEHAARSAVRDRLRAGIPTRKLILGAFTLGLYLTAPLRAHATTIDFESIPTGACLAVGSSFSTQGFDFFQPSLGQIGSCDGTLSVLASNGTTAIYEIGEPRLFVSRTGGGEFSLLSIELAEFLVGSSSGYSIDVIGTLSGGGTVSTTLVLDGVNDGPGGVADFELFTLPGAFTNLLSVELNGFGSIGPEKRFFVDNLVVPEPGTFSLLAVAFSGLACSGGRRRSMPR